MEVQVHAGKQNFDSCHKARCTSYSRRVQVSNVLGFWLQKPYLQWYLGPEPSNIGWYLDPLGLTLDPEALSDRKSAFITVQPCCPHSVDQVVRDIPSDSRLGPPVNPEGPGTQQLRFLIPKTEASHIGDLDTAGSYCSMRSEFVYSTSFRSRCASGFWLHLVVCTGARNAARRDQSSQT